MGKKERVSRIAFVVRNPLVTKAVLDTRPGNGPHEQRDLAENLSDDVLSMLVRRIIRETLCGTTVGARTDFRVYTHRPEEAVPRARKTFVEICREVRDEANSVIVQASRAIEEVTPAGEPGKTP